ncbi:MAG: TRAP transporter small permease [Shimia sp.]
MYRWMRGLADGLALVGGAVLAALIVMVCASVLGREVNAVLNGDWAQGAFPGLADALLATGIGPVTGDFELVEAGIAFAIFCFVPLCQITAGHATVDIFTSGLSAQANRVLRALWEVVFAAVLILIAVQLQAGTAAKIRNGETSFLLQFPVWWGYAAALVAAVAGAVVATYMAGLRLAEAWGRTDLLPIDAPPEAVVEPPEQGGRP